MAASPSKPPSPAGRASSMVSSGVGTRPSTRWRIRRVSRSLTSVLPSASATKPQGEVKPLATSLTVGERAAAPPPVRVSVGEPAAALPPVRVSALGSLAAGAQPVRTTRRAAMPRPAHGEVHRLLSTVSVSPRAQNAGEMCWISGLQVGGGERFDRLRLTDQLDLGDRSPAVGVQHQLTRLADQRHDRRPADRPDRVRLPIVAGRAKPLENHTHLGAPKPRPGQQLEPAPHPLLDIRTKISRGVRLVSGPSYVLMVYEELGRVGSLVDSREGEDGEPGGPAPNPIDQLGEFPP